VEVLVDVLVGLGDGRPGPFGLAVQGQPGEVALAVDRRFEVDVGVAQVFGIAEGGGGRLEAVFAHRFAPCGARFDRVFGAHFLDVFGAFEELLAFAAAGAVQVVDPHVETFRLAFVDPELEAAEFLRVFALFFTFDQQ
jgi:hypothetical protein